MSLGLSEMYTIMMEYLESPYPPLKDEAQTAEYTIPGPEPSEVTTLGAWDCHHCPHKSMLLDSPSRLHTPATSGLWRSTLTTIDRNQIQLVTGPSLRVSSLLTLKWEGPQLAPSRSDDKLDVHTLYMRGYQGPGSDT